MFSDSHSFLIFGGGTYWNSDSLIFSSPDPKGHVTGVENSSSPTPETRILKLRVCHFSVEKARRACL